MDTIPRIAEDRSQIRFDHPMTPQGLQRSVPAQLGEHHPMVRLMSEVTLLGQSPYHAAYGRRGDAKTVGKRPDCHCRLSFPDRVNRLEVVFGGSAETRTRQLMDHRSQP